MFNLLHLTKLIDIRKIIYCLHYRHNEHKFYLNDYFFSNKWVIPVNEEWVKIRFRFCTWGKEPKRSKHEKILEVAMLITKMFQKCLLLCCVLRKVKTDVLLSHYTNVILFTEVLDINQYIGNYFNEFLNSVLLPAL